MQRTMIVGMLFVFGLVSGAPLAQADDPDAKRLRTLLQEKRSHLVTIEATIERAVSGPLSRRSETEKQLQGVLLDGAGTILTTSEPFDSSSREVRGEEMRIERSPKKLSVRIEGHEKPLTAHLKAKDERLGLVFLKLENPGEGSFSPMDLSTHRPPKVGERVVWISRRAETFQFAPVFRVTRINGSVTEPRKMWSMSESPPAGRPVFAPGGTLLGVTVQIQVEEDSDGGGLFGRMLRSLRGGSGTSTFLLPVDDLKNAWEQARERIKKEGKQKEPGESDGKQPAGKSEDGESPESEEDRDEDEEGEDTKTY